MSSAFERYCDDYAVKNQTMTAEHSQTDLVSFWHNHVNEFLTKDDVVFARTLKCGSSFYMNLLLENGWRPIAWDQIAWGQQPVFGFIMDPWQRRYRGLAEDLFFFYNQQERETLLSLNANFLARSILGEHSIPISSWFGEDKIGLIDWIPVDAEVSSFDLFAKFLLKHNQRITVDDLCRHRNQSSAEQQQLRDIIEQRIQSNQDLLRSTYLLLSQDLALYNAVMSRINLSGNSWDDISWLRSRP